jgi:glutaredoxin 3
MENLTQCTKIGLTMIKPTIMATIWSKKNCNFCRMAVSELEKRGYGLKVQYIDNEYSKEDLLKVVPNAKTVPQIFIEDRYIGGYTELMEYFALPKT